jgi:Ni/Fe-hydrogenase 1 B-type cytochrome subunit
MIGHNPLAGLTYIAIYVLFLLQVVTGFALYSMGLPASIWATLFGWMITAFGAQPVRLTHDIVMYLLIAFTIHHVYSAILIDVEERSGLLSSIVTGFKSLSRRQISRARAEENPPKRR